MSPHIHLEEITNLEMEELCDLLSSNTQELMNLINKKGSDGYLNNYRSKKSDVEVIQLAIAKKIANTQAVSFSS